MNIWNTILSLFVILSIVSICSLKNFETLHSLKIDIERPIIAYDYIFYLKSSAIKALNKYYSEYDMFGNSYRKPLMNKGTKWGDAVFFTKDCRLEMWEYQGKDTLNGHILFERTFNELKGDYCYGTLDMFYDDNQKDIAVYNTRNNKITVFNLNDKNIYLTNDNIIGKVEMDYNIKQALLYNYDKDTTLLIGIDSSNIKFYNVRGSYSWRDWFVNNRLIKSIKLNTFFNPLYGQKIAGIMDIDNKKDKLLYIDDRLILYDLKDFKTISTLLLNKLTTVLTLKNGNALIGTEDGFIYLIKYNNKNLNLLDGYNVCNGEVLDISYDNAKYYFSKYILLVQCYEKNGYYLKHVSLDNIS